MVLFIVLIHIVFSSLNKYSVGAYCRVCVGGVNKVIFMSYITFVDVDVAVWLSWVCDNNLRVKIYCLHIVRYKMTILYSAPRNDVHSIAKHLAKIYRS